MLEVNEEKQQITTDKLKKEFGIEKYPVVFKLSNRYRKYDAINKRFSVPRGFTFDTFYSLITQDRGTEVLRYFTNKTSKGAGLFAYTPSDVGFNDSDEWRLNKGDIDLIYFLCMHPRSSTSPYKDESRPSWFYLENKAKDAAVKVAEKRAKSRANDLLFGSTAMDTERLREVARSYQIANVNGKTDDELRVDLEVISKKNTDEFLDRAESKKDLKTLSLINKCTNAGIIKFIAVKKGWFINNGAQVTKADKICEVRPGENEHERLAEWLTKFDETDMLEYLSAKLEEKELVE